MCVCITVTRTTDDRVQGGLASDSGDDTPRVYDCRGYRSRSQSNRHGVFTGRNCDLRERHIDDWTATGSECRRRELPHVTPSMHFAKIYSEDPAA